MDVDCNDVVKGEIAAPLTGPELDVVDPHGRDGAGHSSAVRRVDDNGIGTILKADEHVAQSAAAASCRPGRIKFSFERLVHLPAQAPAEHGQIGVVQRIQGIASRLDGGSPSSYQVRHTGSRGLWR